MRSELNHKTVTKSSGAHRFLLSDEYLTSLFLCLLRFPSLCCFCFICSFYFDLYFIIIYFASSQSIYREQKNVKQ